MAGPVPTAVDRRTRRPRCCPPSGIGGRSRPASPGAGPARRSCPRARLATDQLLAVLDDRQPRRAGDLRRDAVEATLREAERPGSHRRRSAQHRRPPPAGAPPADAAARRAQAHRVADALTAALPADVDHVLIQADLTVVAPGPAGLARGRSLRLLADVESRGHATVYRIGEGSIRRALDAGWDAAAIHALLAEISQHAGAAAADLPHRRHRPTARGGADRQRHRLRPVRQPRDAERAARGPAAAHPRAEPPCRHRARQPGARTRADLGAACGRLRPGRREPRRQRRHPAARGPPHAGAGIRPRSPRADCPSRRSSRPASGRCAPPTAQRRTIAVRRSPALRRRPAARQPERRRDRDHAALRDRRAAARCGSATPTPTAPSPQQIVDPIRSTAGVLTAFDHRTEQVRGFAVSRVTGVRRPAPGVTVASSS